MDARARCTRRSLACADFETSYSRINDSGSFEEEVDGIASTLGGAVAAGYRQNFMPWLGISARLGAGIAGVIGYSFADSTQTIDGEEVETTFDESSLLRGGGGVDVGMWLLPREQLDLNMRVKLDTAGQLHLQLAVGWAFVLG